jgi:hypothetical protein
MRIIIIGDSHTRALKNHMERSQDFNNYKNLYEIYWLTSAKNEKNGKRHGDLSFEKAKELISTLTEEDCLVFSLLGTAHNIYGLLKHNIPFTTCKHTHIANQELIPYNVIKQFYLDFMKKNKSIDILRSIASRCKLIHMSTPPPKRSNQFIMENSHAYRDISVNEVTLNENTNRLAMWQIEMDALATYCIEAGMEILPPPKEVLDEEGFLKDIYYSSDATHANIKYGRQVIAQLEELI